MNLKVLKTDLKPNQDGNCSIDAVSVMYLACVWSFLVWFFGLGRNGLGQKGP